MPNSKTKWQPNWKYQQQEKESIKKRLLTILMINIIFGNPHATGSIGSKVSHVVYTSWSLLQLHQFHCIANMKPGHASSMACPVSDIGHWHSYDTYQSSVQFERHFFVFNMILTWLQHNVNNHKFNDFLKKPINL